MPFTTWPKTVYFASRCGCGECVMKNWLPPVSRHCERHARRTPRRIRPIVQLVANRVARSAVAVPARIAVLHDEVRNDPVNLQPVEEALPASAMKLCVVCGASSTVSSISIVPFAVSMNAWGEYCGDSSSGELYGATPGDGTGRMAWTSSADRIDLGRAAPPARIRNAQSLSVSAVLSVSVASAAP